jgi:hypothetical protein
VNGVRGERREYGQGDDGERAHPSRSSKGIHGVMIAKPSARAKPSVAELR